MPTAATTPAGTACHLTHHLKGPFVGAEVGAVEQGVGIEYTHHAHMVEVEPFGHHLSANEQVGLEMFESLDNLLVSRLGTRGVEVHTRRPRLRKTAAHLFFNLFGALAFAPQVVLPATRTGSGECIGGAAIVAHQSARLAVVGERHVASHAARCPAAGVAFHHRRIAAAVDEEDGLSTAVENRTGVVDEAWRERRLHQFLTP